MNRYDLITYRTTRKWIDERIELANERKASLNKMVATYSDMPKGSSPIHDRVAEGLADILDETAKLMEEVLEKENLLMRVERTWEKIENEDYQTILKKLYLDKTPLNLTEVSNIICKEYTYTCKLHGRALNEFDNLCKNTIKDME